MSEKKSIQFICFVLFVKNIEESKKFYQSLLEQTIEMDFGRNVTFKGGLSLWDGAYASQLMRIKNETDANFGQNNLEIYFEIEDINYLFKKIKRKNIPFVHEIIEQPWGQRCFRIYDPDEHIVEIGEPMKIVVKRCFSDGMDLKQIHEKTLMPLDFIKSILK